ncbi:23S rRNA (uracil1939-C5)-methyltransferase [Desulfovibrio litoralis DSM 11393]|uniref:23S rRNA (Uracil1939-C5)-methyltransferase n=2 Tax=Desulfovibrio litoralis TaxID=466107 RepID=A0A1M7T6J0_9BACT|nr:23S rRNA (uracil1939-C5)-methyltransferase [Desulfovibrio litoralis DSM 11393]
MNITTENKTTTLQINDMIELDITALAVGGRGVARYNGMVFFVEQALPGQKVLAKITVLKPRMGEAELMQVIKPSQHESAPLCKHFGACGGCDWQTLEYNQQLFWKKQIFIDCLTRIGKYTNQEIDKLNLQLPLASPKREFFRNKMEFAFSEASNNTQNEQGEQDEKKSRPLVGLKQRFSHNVEEITDCKLQTPLTMRILELTREWLDEEVKKGHRLNAWVENFDKKNNSKHYPKQDHAKAQALLRHLVVREPELCLQTEQAEQKQCLVELITTPFHLREASLFKRLGLKLLNVLAQEYGDSLSFGFIHSVRADKASVAQGEKIVQSFGTLLLKEKLGDITLQFDARSFMQTNTGLSNLLINKAKDLCLDLLPSSAVIWDLYCGVGTFALSFAQAFQEKNCSCEIFGMELAPASIFHAKENAKNNNLDNCTFLQANAETTLKNKKLLSSWTKPDLVFLDPPRTGIKESLCQELLQLAPQYICCVSCYPATLARDLNHLKSKYTLVSAEVFDMFPHSSHLESLVLLKRKI